MYDFEEVDLTLQPVSVPVSSWASPEFVRSYEFEEVQFRAGYDQDEVRKVLQFASTLLSRSPSQVTNFNRLPDFEELKQLGDALREETAKLTPVQFQVAYDKKEVEEFLDNCAQELDSRVNDLYRAVDEERARVDAIRIENELRRQEYEKLQREIAQAWDEAHEEYQVREAEDRRREEEARLQAELELLRSEETKRFEEYGPREVEIRFIDAVATDESHYTAVGKKDDSWFIEPGDTVKLVDTSGLADLSEVEAYVESMDADGVLNISFEYVYVNPYEEPVPEPQEDENFDIQQVEESEAEDSSSVLSVDLSDAEALIEDSNQDDIIIIEGVDELETEVDTSKEQLFVDELEEAEAVVVEDSSATTLPLPAQPLKIKDLRDLLQNAQSPLSGIERVLLVTDDGTRYGVRSLSLGHSGDQVDISTSEDIQKSIILLEFQVVLDYMSSHGHEDLVVVGDRNAVFVTDVTVQDGVVLIVA